MPVVKLNFATEEEKRLFMGGLCDGWGENYCSLSWNYSRVPFDDCNEFTVFDVYDPREEFEYDDDE